MGGVAYSESFNSPCVTVPWQIDEVTNVRGGGKGGVILNIRNILGLDIIISREVWMYLLIKPSFVLFATSYVIGSSVPRTVT